MQFEIAPMLGPVESVNVIFSRIQESHVISKAEGHSK